MKLFKKSYFSVLTFILISLFSSCNDRKHTYYEITEEKVIYHYVERRASNFFTATYHERSLNDVDMISFSILDKEYAKDKNHIFYEGISLLNRDVKSFKVLEHSLSSDNLGAYYRNQMIEGSDGKSFRILNAHYYKDKANIYVLKSSNVSTLGNADFPSFKVVSGEYAKDKEQVFFSGDILEGLDIKQFKLLESYYCIDPNYVFYKDLKVAANSKYFEVLEHGYAKDDKSIFYEDININADYNSFKINSNRNDSDSKYFAEDKYFYYSGITTIKK